MLLIGSNFIYQPDGSQTGLSNQLHSAWEYERRIMLLSAHEAVEWMVDGRTGLKNLNSGKPPILRNELSHFYALASCNNEKGLYIWWQGQGSKPWGPHWGYHPGKSWRGERNVNHVVFNREKVVSDLGLQGRLWWTTFCPPVIQLVLSSGNILNTSHHCFDITTLTLETESFLLLFLSAFVIWH